MKGIYIFSAILIIIILGILYYFYFGSKTGQKEPDITEVFPKYMFNESSYAPSSDGFSGITIKELVQPKSFYTKNHEATVAYLSAVYPQGVDSIKLLDPLQLASFYNSLTFYYNCSFQYQDNDLGGTDTTWGPLPCSKKSPLPYPPQGVFYNFYTYQKYNIPLVYSDSDESKEYLKVTNFGNCRPGLAFTSSSIGRQNSQRPGPGMFWVNCRTILRHIWDPLGPFNSREIGDINDSNDNWSIVLNKPVKWDYPKNWLKGFSDNQYVEVTHYFYGAGGVSTSPGWWYAVFAGTGVFVNLGKTASANTKIGALLYLAQVLVQTQTGRDLLLKQFGSSDPYMVVYNIQTVKVCSPIVPCSQATGPQGGNGITYEISLPLENDFSKAIVAYQNKNNISQSQVPVQAGIKAAIDAAINITDYNLFRFSDNVLCDEPIFFMGLQLGLDTFQCISDPNSNGYFMFEVVDYRIPPKYIPKIKNNRDYSDMINLVNTGSNNPNVWSNTFNVKFLQESVIYAVENDIFTSRDPLDVYNDSKAKKCTQMLSDDPLVGGCASNKDPLFMAGRWYNAFTDDSLSKEYRCLNLGTDESSGSPCNLNSPTPAC